MRHPKIQGLAYKLGETQNWYRECEAFPRVLAEHNIADTPDEFGWGHFHRSSLSILELGVLAAEATLEETNVDRSKIDLVIVCSSQFERYGVGGVEKDCADLLLKLGLENAHVVGITLANCVSLISTLSIADALLQSGRHNCILVISSDLAIDEDHRFREFAVFSDSALSFIISNDATVGFSPIGFSFESKPSSIEAPSIFVEVELAAKTGENLLEKSGVNINDLRMVFPSNMFLPLIKIRETSYGAKEDIVFTQNVERLGHCFSADPFLNLCDFQKQHPLEQKDIVALSSNAPGLRAMTLLRYDSD